MYQAIGCHGENVARPQEIRPAFYRAFDSGKAAVVNVALDLNVPFEPGGEHIGPGWVKDDDGHTDCAIQKSEANLPDGGFASPTQGGIHIHSGALLSV